MIITHKDAQYPHAGGCTECRRERVCNYCGTDIKGDWGRCTNGRCTHCHTTVCTPGGAMSFGHNYGQQGTDWNLR